MAIAANNGIVVRGKKHAQFVSLKMDSAKAPNKSYPYAVINGKERKLSKASAYFLDMVVKEPQ
jgi:hypothetical protein